MDAVDEPPFLETTVHVRAAFTDPEFAVKLAAYLASAMVSPHLFRKLGVPDVCVAT